MTGLFRFFQALWCSAFLLWGVHAQAQTADDIHFTSDPAISPDGETVIFTYEKDLWQVPAAGGRASRLTGMDGEETAPSISPDGRWVAFTANQYGSDDVYLMPMGGGEIERLTFHQGDDIMESWSWDSDTLYFRSDRYNRTSSYAVPRTGGTPHRLFSHYHNNVHNLVKHPDRNEYFFNESWESFISPQRKKYRGPYNPDIKSYNTDTGQFITYTDWEGKDFGLMMDRSGALYFVSDEETDEYNLFTLEEGNKRRLTDFTTSVRNPAMSADGSTIVFEKEYQLHTYDIASGESQQIPISIAKNNTLAKQQSFDVANNISAFDVSPDKKKLAFVSRGELFVSDIDGKFIRPIKTDVMGRVLEVVWLADSKALLFNQTVNGYQNWYTVAADGSGSARRLTNEQQNNRMIALNSDRSKGVYLSGRNELVLMDLENFESEVIVEDEFWGFQNEQPRFAPDDKHIVYTARRNFENDMFSYAIDTGERINLTNTGVSETSPFWSPDGKHIFFISSRVQPSYPRGSRDTDLYRMALTRNDEPYRSERFDKLFTEDSDEESDTDANKNKKDKKKKDNKPSITITEEGLMQRLEKVGAQFGAQFNPFVIQDDEKTTVLYISNHDEGDRALWKTTWAPFESPKTEKFDHRGAIGDITQVDGDLYGLSQGSIYTINADAGTTEKIALDYEFERNLRNEFDQMFEELWANIEENFYNETFHGIDWQEIRARYRSYLPDVNSRDDFQRLLNDMLGELNASHLGFYTRGPEAQTFYKTVTLATGIRYEEDQPYRVRHVVKDSPADFPDKNIKPGDELIAVNGETVDTSKNRESYFSESSMPPEMRLTFARDGDTHTVKLHPASYTAVRSALYDEWVNHNQTMVDEASDKGIAYVHMKNMGGRELENFIIEMTSEAHERNGLILDLRYNTGGNVHDDVLQFLSQRKYLQWKYRNGAYASQPSFTPANEPMVMLINEQSLSDAEVTAAGFKELDLGTLIGMPTYRWIIFTSGKGLVDGSNYRMPSWGVYTLDGQNLERTGVSPDIRIDNTFKDRLRDEDPQLQRAIEFIQAQQD